MKRFRFPTKEKRERISQSQAVERMMEEAGIVRLRGTASPFHAAWHQSQRYLPEFQSTYLDQITKLREILIQTEHHKLKDSMRRSRLSFASPESNTSTKTQPMPARDKLVRRRKDQHGPEADHQSCNRLTHAPRLESAMSSSSVTSRGSKKSLPMISGGHREECITGDATGSRPLSWPDVKQRIVTDAAHKRGMTPQSSIPNIGRRSLKTTGAIGIPLDKNPPKLRRSNTCIIQKTLHEKGHNGEYFHHLLRPDKDETILTPGTFQFDFPDVHGIDCLSHDGKSNNGKRTGTRQSFSEPRYHPRDKVLCIQKRRCSYTAYPGQKPKQRNISRFIHLSSQLQNEILKQYQGHGTHITKVGNNENCLFCENPGVSMIPTGQGQYLMIDSPVDSQRHQRNHSLQGHNELGQGHDNIIEFRDSEPPDRSFSRRSLVVEMPRMPLTPSLLAKSRLNSAASVRSATGKDTGDPQEGGTSHSDLPEHFPFIIAD